MKKKLILKIAWVGITCLAVLASCVRMESNVIRVYAEDATEPSSDLGDWAPYLQALQFALTELDGAPPKVNAIMTATEFAIAQTVPLAVSEDITVFNGITHVIGDYNYTDASGVTTYHLCHIAGNSRKTISEVGYQYDLLQYPSGSKAFAQFGSTGTIWLYGNSGSLDVTGSGFSAFGYSAPNSVSVTGFQIWYGGGSASTTVSKSYYNDIYPDVLCCHWASTFGHDHIRQYNNWFTTEHAFMFPEVDSNMSSYMDVNDYLDLTYQKFEDDFGVEFEYTYPDLVPVGTLLPDGSIVGGNQSGDGDITVNVEFPTHLVPDVPEPDTYDYSQIQQVEIPLANEGVIKATWISGFSALVETMVYTMDAFHLRDLVFLLCLVGIFVYLIVRY